jgi:anti-sigma-K factor RskA
MTDAPTTAPAGEDDDRILAGEYVLGVLDASQRVAAQYRIANEAAFAQAVDWWEQRLTPLVAETAAVEPGAGLWPRISSLIVARPRPRSSLATWGVAWSDVRVLRGVAAGALALAAACLVIVALPARVPPPVAPPPVVAVAPTATQVAVIADPDTREARLVATLDPAHGQLVLTPVALAAPKGRDLELWIIPEGGKPLSLGVIAGGAPTRLAAPAGLKAEGAFTATLAVTDEPPGGSPTGAPTGSIRAAGQFIRT